MAKSLVVFILKLIFLSKFCLPTKIKQTSFFAADDAACTSAARESAGGQHWRTNKQPDRPSAHEAEKLHDRRLRRAFRSTWSGTQSSLTGPDPANSAFR